MEPETDFLEDDNAPRGQPRRVWSDASVLAGMGDRVEQFKAHLKDSKGASARVHPARLPVIPHSPPLSLASDAHRNPRRRAGNVKAELDVFVSTGGLRLVKPDGKVLGSFPLQRIQEWSITSPGTFSLSVVNGEKVVGLVIHGDPDEVFAIIDCLERQVAQILEDMRAKEEGREAADVSSPPRRMPPEPVGERDPPASEPVAEDGAPEGSIPPAPARAFAAEDDAPGEVSEEDLPEDLPQAMSPSEFEDEVVPFRRQRESPRSNEPPRSPADERMASAARRSGVDEALDAVSVSDEELEADSDDAFESTGEKHNTPESPRLSPRASPAASPRAPRLPRSFSSPGRSDPAEKENEEKAAAAAARSPPPPRFSSPRGEAPRAPPRAAGHSPESRMAATMAAAAEGLGELKRRLREAEGGGGGGGGARRRGGRRRRRGCGERRGGTRARARGGGTRRQG